MATISRPLTRPFADASKKSPLVEANEFAVLVEFNATFNSVTMEFIQNIYAGNNAAALANLINRRIEADRVKGHSLNWNARLTYTVLKGQLLLMLDGYDILHNLSNVSYTMNAQARTETIRTVLPLYFMFHLQWRFNHIPKKKKR